MLKIKKEWLKLETFFRNNFNGYEMIAVFILVGISLTGIFLESNKFLEKFLATRIAYRGHITEGTVGSINNANPYFPINQTDKDMRAFLFGGLTRKDGLTGKYTLDLAENIDISADGLLYTVKLGTDSYFTDGTPITSDDMVFTVQEVIQNKSLKIDESIHFEDVTIQRIDLNTVTFKLNNKDEHFLEYLSFPILSFKYFKSKAEADFQNLKLDDTFVGSGPFYITSIYTSNEGIIEEINFKRYDNGSEKLPYTDTYTLKIFPNEEDTFEAFNKSSLDIMSGVKTEILGKLTDDKKVKFSTTTIPTYYSLFLNQENNDLLQIGRVREALNDSIDKNLLVNKVLGGFGENTETLTLSQNTLKNKEEIIQNLTSNTNKSGTRFYFENGLLYKGTKKVNSSKEKLATSTKEIINDSNISFTIVTVENVELEKTAEFIKESWEKIGIKVTILPVSKNELSDVLKNRKFDILLYGVNINENKDYYSFFHSSQRTYPKLNISNYSNKKVDEAVENINNLKADDETGLSNEVAKLDVELKKDLPIIFLYKPVFVYTTKNQKLLGLLPNKFKNSEDKYALLRNWFTDTEKVLFFMNEGKIGRWINALEIKI